ncbi:MAG: hypothetical protein EXS39_04465 [Opitutaceae bacterium]|nr:hypothetical protein [Opitutaceae bacterium]
MQIDIAKIHEINERFLRLISNESADAVQLPSPPPFRAVKWVEALTQMANGEGLGELRRCETEAREFCNVGMKALLAQAEDVRVACQEVRKEILVNSWVKLRAYALAHFVVERDVDEVLAELINHRAVADLKKVAAVKVSRNPFAAER